MALTNRNLDSVTLECTNCGKRFNTDNPYGVEQEGYQYRRFCTVEQTHTNHVAKEVYEQ